MRKESSRTVCLIKTQVIEFGNETTWSTRRAKRAPGAPFSWATCDETKAAALPRSRGQDDGRGWRRPEGGVGNQRCEENSCSAARYSPPSSNFLRELVKGTEQSCCVQAEVLGTDMPCRSQGFSTSSRRKSKQCENFDSGPILLKATFYQS